MNALKKLHLHNLGDLDGISDNDFRRVSRSSSKLVLELDELISAVRLGDDISRKVDDVTTKIHDQAAQDLDRFLFGEKFST